MQDSVIMIMDDVTVNAVSCQPSFAGFLLENQSYYVLLEAMSQIIRAANNIEFNVFFNAIT